MPIETPRTTQRDRTDSSTASRLHAVLYAEGPRLLRFGLVGLVTTATYALVSLLIIEKFGLPALIASMIGFMSATGISYLGHALFSFRVKGDHKNFVWRFLVLAGGGFISVTGLVWLLDVLNVSPRMTIALVVLIIPLLTYLFNRLWVFGSALEPLRLGPEKTHKPR